MPKMSQLKYGVYYISKNNRSLLGNSWFLIKIFYEARDSYLYIVPKKVVPQVYKQISLIILVGEKKFKYRLKPFFIGLVISMLGMTFRFKVFIRVKGLGYKVYVLNSGNTINLKLGFSHLVKFNFFRGMFATKLGQKDRMFSVEGNNWIILTNTLARIRSFKKVDYYRGKGIFKKFYICKIRQGKKKKK